MKQTAKRVASLIICAAMLAVSLATPAVVSAAETLKDDDFTYLVQLPGTYGCSTTQGMAVGEEYIYSSMVGGNNTVAALWRFNKENGQIRNMKNGDTGEQTFSNLGHVNDMDVAVIDGVEYLFVLASGNDIETGNIIVFKVDGRTLYQKAQYTLNYNGGNFNPAGMAVCQADNEKITFAFKWSHKTISTGSIDWEKENGNISVSILCYLDSSGVVVNGKKRDFTGFANQGIYVYGDTLFAVYAGCYAVETVYQSLILGFDLSQIEKGTPTLKPSEDLIFYMESENFPRCFEVEDCGISSDGKLYFNANCWKSLEDTTHDGVFVLNDFVAAEPTATEPPATEPPATEPPATEPPATEPPATEPPATEPPATEPPATEPPATEPPATEPPATEPPATEPPATEPPATEPPATEPPATEPPVTEVPVEVEVAPSIYVVAIVAAVVAVVAVVAIVLKKKKK